MGRVNAPHVAAEVRPLPPWHSSSTTGLRPLWPATSPQSPRSFITESTVPTGDLPPVDANSVASDGKAVDAIPDFEDFASRCVGIVRQKGAHFVEHLPPLGVGQDG